MRLKLPYPMICGRPTPGAVAITLPAAEDVPAKIAASAVRLNGGRVSTVSVNGHTVTVGVALKIEGGHMLCQTFSFGTLAITLTPAAELGNPEVPGTYAVRAKHASSTYSASFRVSS